MKSASGPSRRGGPCRDGAAHFRARETSGARSSRSSITTVVSRRGRRGWQPAPDVPARRRRAGQPPHTSTKIELAAALHAQVVLVVGLAGRDRPRRRRQSTRRAGCSGSASRRSWTASKITLASSGPPRRATNRPVGATTSWRPHLSARNARCDHGAERKRIRGRRPRAASLNTRHPSRTRGAAALLASIVAPAVRPPLELRPPLAQDLFRELQPESRRPARGVLALLRSRQEE